MWRRFARRSDLAASCGVATPIGSVPTDATKRAGPGNQRRIGSWHLRGLLTAAIQLAEVVSEEVDVATGSERGGSNLGAVSSDSRGLRGSGRRWDCCGGGE